MNFHWNSSTLIIPFKNGMFRLFQPFYRRNLIVDKCLLDIAVEATEKGISSDALKEFWASHPEGIKIADVTEFTLWELAMGNADFMNPNVDLDDCMESLNYEDALELLEEVHILERDEDLEFDYSKRGFADRFRGSFFEQIGTEALFKRDKPVEWWTRQKFTDDLKEIRQTPYRYIEEHFLTSYFAEKFSGLDVLEIGCGTGYFTQKIAKHANATVGMDYNEEYIKSACDIASELDMPNLEFHVGDIIDLSKGASIFQEKKFDRIILIDTFLFLFDKDYQIDLWENRFAILENIKSLLKPDGKLLIMNPHPFWLTPWVGHKDMPIGILTEYRNRSFRVIPSVQEYSELLHDAGMRICRILEPDVDDAYEKVNPQAYKFMKQFPQWWFFETEKI